jgi:uncharacterized protein (DUF1501 family)
MNRDQPAPINRRSLLKLGLAAGGAALAARYSFAAPAASPSRFVFIILRGALTARWRSMATSASILA